MDNLERIASSDYVPNDDDILRARQRTVGSGIVRFEAYKYSWQIIDVGGQKIERDKWKSIMSEHRIAAIIYFSSLDEYNVEPDEEPKNNRTKMEESMDVFKLLIADNDELDDLNTCLILFLNKSDIFFEKLKTKRGMREFEEKFPEYNDYMENDFPNDERYNEYDAKERKYIGCFKVIEKKFRSLTDSPRVSSHMTCAIDTEKMGAIFLSIKEYIFMVRLGLSGAGQV